MTTSHASPAADLNALLALNDDYIRSVQTSDVARFEQILADDFLVTLPDGRLLDRGEFLAYTAKPAPIRNLRARIGS